MFLESVENQPKKTTHRQKVTMNAKPERDYFRFTLNCYDQSGLRKSSKFLQKCVSLYILYPVMYILLFMIIYNFRFKHNIVEFAEVFGSAAAYANVISPVYNNFYYILNFSSSLGKPLFWHTAKPSKR